jgi:hypothetical protein
MYMSEATNAYGVSNSYGHLEVVSNTVTTTTASQSYVVDDGSSDFQVIGTSEVKKIQGSKSGHPPEFKKLFYDLHVNLGDNVRLDTIILGSPKPKVSFKMICEIFYFNYSTKK